MEYDYWAPTLEIAEGAPVRVLVLMHGRGASRHDLSALQGRLPRAWHVVVPDAPHAASPWGYGPGRAWYKFLGDDRPDSVSLESSLAAVDDLIASLPSILGNAPTHLVLGGFSQGGTMGNAYALTRPQRLQGVLNFSGFLPSTLPVSSDVIRGTRFFWGHGIQDMNIPFALAQKGRSALREAKADLDARDYAIGHWIDPDELRDASTWLSAF
jgi:phospholipase/carboxylesterase